MSRSTSGLLLVALIILAAWLAWDRGLIEHSRQLISADSDRDTTADSMPATAAEALAEMRARYARRPDQRFLDAADLLSSDEPVHMELDRESLAQGDHRWVVSAAGRRTTLDGLTDFNKQLVMLRQLSGLSAKPQRLGYFRANPGFEASQLLTTLDAQSQDNDALVDAARAAVRLAWLSESRWYAADEFMSRAIALLVRAESQFGAVMLEERSMLALSMGYRGHAYELGNRLPVENAWRAYLEDDGDKLDQLASAGNRDAQLLHARWLTVHRDWVGWSDRIQAMSTSDSLPMAEAQIGYIAGDFDSLMVSFLSVPAMTMLLLEGSGPESLPQANEHHWARRADAFEQELAASESLPGETMLGRDAATDLLRSWYYDALLRQYFYYQDQLARSDLAESFASVLAGNHEERPRALGTWLAQLDRNTGERIPELASLGLSGWAHQRQAEEAQSSLEWADPEAGRIVSHLASSLDGRPDHESALRRITMDHPGHMALTDSLLRAEQRRSSGGVRRVWLATYFGDEDYLRQAAADENYDWSGRQSALRQLRYRDGSDPMLERAHEQQIERRPGRLPAYEAFADYLANRGDHQQAIEVLRAWQAGSTDPRDSFARQDAASRISELYRDLGEPEHAMQELIPFAGSMRSTVLMAQARTLDALGEHEDALTLAAVNLERYPDSDNALKLILELLWGQAHYDTASRILVTQARKLGQVGWGRIVGRTLADTLEECSSCIKAAMTSMSNAGISHEALFSASSALSGIDDGRLSVELLQAMRPGGQQGVLRDLRTASLMLRYSPPSEASDWLSSRSPPNGCGMFVPMAYNERGYLWLWTITRADQCAHSEDIWVLRTAALLEPDVATPDRVRQALKATDTMSNDRLKAYMKLLLGVTPESELAQRQDGRRELVTSAYYLGLRAFAEGRPDNGAEWFQLTVEHGRSNEAEYRWAYSLLYSMRSKRSSLGDLAEQGETPASAGLPTLP